MTDPERVLSHACRYRNEELLRIGLLDLSDELSIEEVGLELSALARALLAEILELSLRDADERFGAPEAGASLTVLALGSLGGDELSYGSDLDLLFLYSAPGETRGGRRGRTNHQEYFARAAQRLIGLLATPVREGFLYRTDSRLRPSGNQGALVASLAAFREYHGAQAQLWERQSLLRASFAAGDRCLFERALREVIEPTVYAPLADAAEAGREITRLRRRMELELAGETEGRYNPKLGQGGLVDIEFTVQFLQLAHGHRCPDVRGPRTGPALEALARAGLIPQPESFDLRDSHSFLRRLEGRLRIAHDVRQTHLPRAGRALAILARRMGPLGDGSGEPGARLQGEYRRRTARVRAIFERITEDGSAGRRAEAEGPEHSKSGGAQ